MPSLSSSTRRTRPTGSALGRLVAPLVQPGIFDFWVGHLNPAWSWERPLARVVERRVEAADTVTLVLRPNRHCGSFQPGQHVNLSAEVNGRRVTRSYSYTGTPQTKGPNKGLLSFTIKRTEGGRLSTHLCRDLRAGDVVELGEAFGEMTLPAQPQGKWLFLAAGSGITPLMSLTRALVEKQMPVDLTLVYWAKTRAELCFLLELRQLAASQPRFKLHTVLTHEAQLLAGEHSGFISAEQLQELVGDLSEQQVYACGPGGFVETARELTAGVARSFMAEGFTPSAPAVDPSEVKEVRVTLLKSGRELTVSSGTSLLDALEAQGLNPKSGCRMGICHSCVCTKHSGTVQDINTKDTDSEGDTPVRICVSRATTDVSLDL